MKSMHQQCRCGWDGMGEHLCHRFGRAPGSMRFYNPRPVALAGQQMKFEVYDTWGCDPCWEDFKRLIKGVSVEDVP